MTVTRKQLRPCSDGRHFPHFRPGLWVVTIALAFAVALTASHGGPRSAAAAGEEMGKPAASSDPRPQRCESCHQLDSSLSHPVNIAVARHLPGQLPLEAGRLTCTTCHIAIEHDRAGRGSMLRPEIEVNQCSQCHEPSRSSGQAAHASGFRRAHLTNGKARNVVGSVALAGSPRNSGLLDEESRACMGCHDGSMAGDAGAHSGSLNRMLGSEGEHPIGVTYRPLIKRKGADDIRLVDQARLDPRVRLFNQQVGCGSCHSVYSKQQGLLVMSNLRSKLCLSCHIE